MDCEPIQPIFGAAHWASDRIAASSSPPQDGARGVAMVGHADQPIFRHCPSGHRSDAHHPPQTGRGNRPLPPGFPRGNPRGRGSLTVRTLRLDVSAWSGGNSTLGTRGHEPLRFHPVGVKPVRICGVGHRFQAKRAWRDRCRARCRRDSRLRPLASGT